MIMASAFRMEKLDLRRPCGAIAASLMEVMVNGKARSVEAPASLAELVRTLGLEGKRIAIERNGEIVPKSRYAETPLQDGDRLEIVGAVGGG